MNQELSFPRCELPPLGYCLCKCNKDSITTISSTVHCVLLENLKPDYVVLDKQGMGKDKKSAESGRLCCFRTAYMEAEM